MKTYEKKFKKGQRVTQIGIWTRQGAFTYRQAVVHSCGVRQMVLTDAVTGENMGNHYRPDGSDGTYDYLPDDQAEALALKLAAEFLDDERAKLQRLSERTEHGEGYCNAMRKNLEALHEPQAFEYNELVAKIRKAAGFAH